MENGRLKPSLELLRADHCFPRARQLYSLLRSSVVDLAMTGPRNFILNVVNNQTFSQGYSGSVGSDGSLRPSLPLSVVSRIFFTVENNLWNE
jgi:hypothetical protein